MDKPNCKICIHKGTEFYYGLCPQSDAEVLPQERNKCFYYERKTMPNIKITAEVDGKQVPLSTISTESFKAIKALEKPKEIPVARVGNWPGQPENRRLFLKISDQFRNVITQQQDIKMVAIELKRGRINNTWTAIDHKLDFFDGDLYENVKPL